MTRRPPPRPTPTAWARAALAVARALGAARQVPPRPWRDVELRAGDRSLPSVAGRLWEPARLPAPPIVLAAGVTPQGVADPRVMRLAGALAAAGRRVFVPALELPQHRIGYADVERLSAAVLALSEDPVSAGSVVGLGFSFGGSFTIVAASDPRVARRLGLVAAFGAYGDLVGLIQAVTTGTSAVDGEVHRWRAHEEMVAVLRERIDATIASRAGGLGPEHRDVVRALFASPDPEEVPRLLARLPAPLPDLLQRLSPVNYADEVEVPLVLLHAVDDPTIPYVEFRRLARAFPDAQVHEVRLFTHVDFRATPRQLVVAARDLLATTRFAATVLAAGDRPPSS